MQHPGRGDDLVTERGAEITGGAQIYVMAEEFLQFEFELRDPAAYTWGRPSGLVSCLCCVVRARSRLRVGQIEGCPETPVKRSGASTAHRRCPPKPALTCMNAVRGPTMSAAGQRRPGG